MLFGFSSAVMQFGRFSAFIEAVGRRVLHLLVSLYVDDAHLTDLSASKGSAQQLLTSFMHLLGTPFAPTKQQRMSTTIDFLGITSCLEQAARDGIVTCFPRARLVTK
eukprot:3308728-Amphidinium_carterae.1